MNKLFPAVPGRKDVMGNVWIRDNYYIYHSASDKTKKRIFRGFEEIVKKHQRKIEHCLLHPPKEDHEYLHPLYKPNLEEIDHEWGFIQNDAIGNLLEILSIHRSRYAQLVYDYLMKIKFWECPDYGMWEEGPKRIQTASINACIKGILAFKFQRPDVKILPEIYTALHKAKEKEADLSLLTLHDHSLLEQVKPLIGKYGVKRYLGDKWNGETRDEEVEPEWCFGLAFLYQITGDKKYLDKLDEIHEQVGYIPEMMINGEPNINTPLNWAEAMYRGISDKHKPF